jgi:hypothetical protein
MNSVRTSSLAAALACGLALVAAHPSAAQVSYAFTNFDGPPDNTMGTTINGINNNGDEVGFSTGATGNFTNFIRDPNGNFTILNIGNDPMAMANGINNSNTVVGITGAMAAFSLPSGSSMPTLLPAPNPGNTASSIAFGINDHGVIVGQYADNSTGTTPGFVDNNGAFTILNPVANSMVTNAQGINNNGLVTGFYSINGVNQFGFLYNTNTMQYTLLPDPSTQRIMTGGLVLTQFLGINDKGEASGYYQTDNGSQFGFLFNTNTDTYTYLDDPFAAPVGGVQITQITGINNAGDISGFYIDANGVQHGFLGAPVPEPGSLGFLAAWGLCGVGLMLHKRRRQAA